MSRFEMTVTMRRTMTPDEARARAVSMGLPKGVVEFIVNEFREYDANSRWRDDGRYFTDDGCVWCVTDDCLCHSVGEEGRLALGSKCTAVFCDFSSLLCSLREGIDDETMSAAFDEFFEK